MSAVSPISISSAAIKYSIQVGTVIGLAASAMMGSVAGAEAKPKFFLCPAGFERDATVVTERYDVNLCSKTMPQAGVDLSTYSILAIRHRRTKKQINLPTTTSDDIVYVARSKQGTIYRFDFNQRLLTIQPKRGNTTREKIIASD